MRAEELGELVRCARTGDPAAGRALWMEIERAVRKHLTRMLGAGAIVDDAVQDTMIAVHRGFARFRGDTASPRTWALAIATRVAGRLRRKEARYQPIGGEPLDI